MLPNPRNTQHGHTRQVKGKIIKSLTYQSWSSMNDRCYNETHKWYKKYGGRGIAVCERWRRGAPNAFKNFLEDMGERPSKAMTLDREKNHLNYCKENCRWADKSTQRQNQDRQITEPDDGASFEDALNGLDTFQ